MTNEKFYTVAEVSKQLGIPGPDVSSRWMRGQFPHAEMRDGVLFIPEADLAPFMELAGPMKERPPMEPIAPRLEPPATSVAPVPVVERESPDPDTATEASHILDQADKTAKEIIAEANQQAAELLKESTTYFENIKAVGETLKQDAETYAAQLRSEADAYFKATKERLSGVENLIAERQAQYDLLNGEFKERRDKMVANIKKWTEYALNDSMNADYLLQRKNAMFRMSESLKRLVGR